MELSTFFSAESVDGGTNIQFTQQQASDFAKGVAGDFNPIHDVGSRRFCVPGDLLFSVLLQHYGVHAESHVQFAGMVDAGMVLRLPDSLQPPLHLNDARGRNLLTLFSHEPHVDNPALAAALAEQYVRFSGKTFPDILVGLMRNAGVMINPDRPLVIYKDMSLHMDILDRNDPVLQLSDADLDVSGKKGLARLRFTVTSGGAAIGYGEKNMVLSGLRPFDEEAMAGIVDEYTDRKQAYRSSTGETQHAV